MSLKTFLHRTRLLLEFGLHEARHSFRDQSTSDMSVAQLAQLEERVMMSASPAAVVAPEAIDSNAAAPESASSPEAELSSQGSQSVQSVESQSFADQVSLPVREENAPTTASDSGLEDQDQHSLELVFIDSSVSNFEQLIADLQSENSRDENRTLQAVVLDSTRDGISQITSALLQHNGVDGVHIVSHGSQGQIQLGSTTLNLESLNQYRSAISAWQYSMADEADILIYGCNVAETEEGQELLHQLSELTGTDVAGSEDLTGAADLGGDWELEFETGLVNTAQAFSRDFIGSYYATLDITTGLVGHYEFEENGGSTLTDSTGIKDGAMNNGATWSTDEAVGTYALDFASDSGSPSYISVSDDAAQDFGSGDFTVSLWYNQIGAPTGIGRLIGDYAGSNYGFVIYAQSNGAIDVELHDGTSIVQSIQGVFDGTWNQLTVVRSGTTLDIFHNGVNVSSSSGAGGDINSSNDLWMGASGTLGGDFDGKLDDVRLYTRALSATDIGELVALGPSVAAPPGPPAGYSNPSGGDNSQDYITNVTFAGIDNTSGQDAAGYGNYSAEVANVTRGGSNDLSVSIVEDDDNYVTAWIDWNQDGDFSDSGEEYVVATATSSPGPHTISIATPGTASLGTTIMRVGTAYSITPVEDGGAQYREFEDYSINVQAVSSTFTVTNTNDSGAGSLRQAIIDSNNNSGADTIEFNIAGSETQVINLSSALDAISDQVTIDGTTQTGWTEGSFLPIVIDGNNGAFDALTFSATSDGSVVRGLVLRDFGSDAIDILDEADNITIAGNFIGQFNSNGTDAGLGNDNTFAAVRVRGDNVVVGGSTPADRNVIAGNEFGVLIRGSATNTVVSGNYIGTDIAGATTIGSTNDYGINILEAASGTTIGGSTTAHSNVIAGVNINSVAIVNEANDNVTIQNNIIGVSADGLTQLDVNGGAGSAIYIANGGDDIQVLDNLIAGARYAGIELDVVGVSDGTVIQGNIIGTDVTGTQNWGVGETGILIENATNTTIGGLGAGDGNVIAFSGRIDAIYGAGIAVQDGGTGNTIRGNSIYSNAVNGVDLSAGAAVDGPTSNDLTPSVDDDAGANNLQNWAVLYAAAIADDGTFSYELDTTTLASGNYTIDFYASSDRDGGQVEGARFLGTGGSVPGGNASYSGSFGGVTLAAGEYVTALVTDANGNTSEFSNYAVTVDSDAGGTAPNDLQAVATSEGGLSINTDGGNDTVLVANDGGAILAGLNAFTLEFQLQSQTSIGVDERVSLLSYLTSTDGDAMYVGAYKGSSVQQLYVAINGWTHVLDTDLDAILNGQQRTLSIAWNNSGSLEYFLDGLSIGSASGFATGNTIASGGRLYLGVDMDDGTDTFVPGTDTFNGTLFDVRIFNISRTATEIAASYRSELPFDEPGLVANWTFSDLSTDGVITDAISGNNLNINHISGSGFTASEPLLTFSLNENAVDGTVVGSVHGIDAEREARIASLLAADPGLRYSAETGKFYKAVLGSTNWSTASTSALTTQLNGVDGQLANIRSATEQEIAATFSVAGALWIGATDATVEGEHRWTQDGADADQFWSGDGDGESVDGAYSNWLSGRPDNSGGNQHYTFIRSDGYWNEEDSAHTENGYLVEWDADEVLDATQAITYSITSQSVAGAFEIDASTGEIRVADVTLLDAGTLASHSVTIRVSDSESTPNTYDKAFTISLKNTLKPTQSVPGTQTVNENEVLTFGSGSSNAVTVSDMLATTDTPLQVFISVNDGVLNLSQTTGLSILGGADGSSFMTLHGTESDINAAFEGMTFTPDTDFTGAVTLTMTTSLGADMVGHYEFEGNTNDTSVGLVEHGTLQGDATTITDGTRGDVLSLDGTGDYVQISGMFSSPPNATLAAWVNLDLADTQGSEVISLGNRLILRLDNPTYGVSGEFYNGSSWVAIASNQFIAGEGWHHVAFTFDDAADTQALYIDGQLVASLSSTESITYTGGTNTHIGSHGQGAGGYDFDGLIDEARIYDRALSADEIQALSADNTSSGDSVAITVQTVNDAPYFTSLPSADPATVESLTGASGVTSGDLDNDGDVDLITTTTSGELRWHENDGSGNFSAGVTLASAQDFTSVVTYDLEGDGDVDIVAMNDDPADTANSVFVLTNQFIGSGSVSFATQSFEGAVGGESDGGQDLAVGDIDGDGRADIAGLFYRSIGDSQLVVFEQNAVGVWTKSYTDAMQNGHGIELVDLDGDSDLDIVAADYQTREVYFYENDGNATAGFSRQSIHDEVSSQIFDMTVGDFDADGDTDVAFITWGTTDVVVMLENDGAANPSFTRTEIAAVPGSLMYHIDAADTNGDGTLDLIVADETQNSIIVYENDGTASFTSNVIDSDSRGPVWVEAADVDGDGQNDLVFAARDDNFIGLHTNQGDGNYIRGTVDEDIALGSLSVQIADDDAGSALLEVTISVVNGRIIMPTGSVSVLSGGSSTSYIRFEGTVADVNTALSSFTYSPTSDFVGLGEVQITVNDRGNTGAGGAKTASEALFIEVMESNNDAPIVSNLGNDYRVVLNDGTAVLLDGPELLTISDVDSTTFDGGSLTVTGNSFDAADSLGFDTSGTVSLSAGMVDGSIVSVGGTAIGTLGSVTSSAFTLSFNSASTQNRVEAAMRNVTFESTATVFGNRSVDFTLVDGDGVADGGTDTANASVVVNLASTTNGLVTATEDTTYTYSVSDFDFTGLIGTDLREIVITRLPSDGLLQLNSVNVTVGQIITYAEINTGQFTFTPGANANGFGYASFDFYANSGKQIVTLLPGEFSSFGINSSQLTNTDQILTNGANFGPAGTYPTHIDFEATSSAIDATYLSQGEIYFGGYVSDGALDAGELAALDAWVSGGGVLISTNDAVSFDAIAEHFGLVIGGTASSIWEVAGTANDIIDGPFGLVGNAGDTFTATGTISYFDSASLAVGDVVIATDSVSGEPTIVMREHGDGWILFTSDEGIFRAGMTGGGTVSTPNDILAANVFAWAIDSAPKTTHQMDINVSAGNDDPIVSHGGTYSINEGDTLNLDASGTTDVDGDTLTYRWDLDNDGQYDNLVTSASTIGVTWGTLGGLDVDDNGIYTIGLQVDDGNGGVVSTTTTVTIENIAPTLTATGAASVSGNTTYTLNLTDVDPGDDTISHWIVNWGDGSIETYAGDPSSVTHVYSNDLAGHTLDITVSAIDEDGQYFEATLLAPAYVGDYVSRFDGQDAVFQGDFAPLGDGISGHANIVAMPSGNYLVSGVTSGNIVQYQPDGTLVGDFVAASDSNLSSPGGMTYGPDGNLYVADYGAGKIVRFDGTTGAYIDDFVASGLTSPLGIAFGPDGDLYVSNRSSSGVIRYDGTTGTLDSGFNVASISGAEDLTFGPDGNVYVGSTAGVIRVNVTDGSTSIFIADGTSGLGLAAGLDFGPDGHLYVADQENDVIRRFHGTTGAYIDDYATGIDGPAYMDFTADHRVTIVDGNDAPVLTDGAAATNTEGTSTLPFSGSAVTDNDATDFDGGVLTVTLIAGNEASDQLYIMGVGGVSRSGSDVLVGATLVGTWSGGSTGTPLQVTFNTDANQGEVEAVYRAVGFRSTSDVPTLGIRSLEATLTDGDGGTSNTASATVNLNQAVNDDPIDISFEEVVHTSNDNPITVIGSQTGSQNTSASLVSGRTVTVSVVSNEVSADIFDSSGNLIRTIHVVGNSDSGDLFGGTMEAYVAAMPDGGFAVVEKVTGYIESGHHGSVIIAQVFDANGNQVLASPKVSHFDAALGFLVSESSGSSGNNTYRSNPTVDVDGSGLITVSWDNTTEGQFEQRQFRIPGPSVSEFANTGSVVATLTGVDPEGDSLTYSIVGGDSNFEIVGDEIRVKAGSTLDYETATSHSFTVRADDGNGGTYDELMTIQVEDQNDVPTIANLGGDTLSYTEGDGLVRIDQSAVGSLNVSDVDSADFDTGTLTVSFVSGSDSAEDTLGIIHTGFGIGEIAVVGNDVRYEGGTIGTFTGGTGGTDLVISLNSSADEVATRALLLSIGYENTDTDNPTEGDRTVRYVLTDGDGGTSANYDTTVSVAAVNDAPVLDSTGTPTLPSITEDDVDNAGMSVADLLAASAGGDPITDVDGDPEGIAITVRNNGRGIWEYSINGGTNWSSVGTVSETSALLLRSTDLVRFNPDGENAPVTDPTFEFRAWDQSSGTAGTKVDVSSNGGTTAFSSASETATIRVTDVNDAPVLDNSGAVTLDAQAEDAGAPVGVVGTVITDLVSISGNVSDVDASSQTGVAITAADTSFGTWWYTTDGGTNWNALGSVSESSARLLNADSNTRIFLQTEADFHGTLANAIGFRAWDQSVGTNGSIQDTTTNGGTTAFSTSVETADITINAVDDSPQLVGTSLIINGDFSSGLTGWVAANNVDHDGSYARFGQIGGPNGSLSQDLTTEVGKTYVLTFAYGDFSATAVQSMHITVDGSSSLLDVNITTGAAENTLQTYQYTFVADSTSTTVAFSDTSADHSGVRGYLDNISAVTDAQPNAALSYSEGDGAVVIDNTLKIKDIDSANISSAVISISTGYANGEDTLSFTDQNGITGAWDSVTGQLTLTGSATVANYETALRSITYNNSSDNPSAATRTISFTANDGTSNSNVQTRGITFTANNDVPTITTSTVGFTYTENDLATLIDSSIMIADVDSADLDSGILTVQVTGNATANDRLYIQHVGSGIGEVGTGGGNISYSGVVVGSYSSGAGGGALTVNFNSLATPEAAQEIARSIQYFNTSEDPSELNRTISFTVTDGDGGTSSVETYQIAVVEVNDAPVGTDNTVNTLEDTEYTFTEADFGFTDVDHSFQSVRISSLPTAGILYVDSDGDDVVDLGEAVSVGDLVTVPTMQSGLFKFVPDTNGNGASHASFSFQVRDDGGTSNGGVNLDQSANVITVDVTAVNDVPIGLPSINGTSTEDQVLTADTSGISDADGLGAFSYQWLRDGSAISGATASTYTLADADVGAKISVQVSYTDGNGTAEGPLTSGETAPVANVNDAPTGLPTITGTATEDQSLTADTSAISDDDGLGAFSYQWLRDGASVSGATGSSYTLGDADVGTKISVQISYTDARGTAEGPLTSTETTTIANVNDAPVLTAPSITVTESGTVVVSSINFSATDIDNDDATLTFLVSSVTGGQFERASAPQQAISSFSQAEVTAGEILFVHDGSETAPTYSVTVFDGVAGDGPQTASVSFTNINDAPQIKGLGGDALTVFNSGVPSRIDVGSLAGLRDSDLPSDYAGGQLQVSGVDFDVADQLGIELSSGISLSLGYANGSVVSIGGTDIGTLAGVSSSTFNVAFNANATLAAVDGLLQAVSFGTTSTSLGNRSIDFTFNDADGTANGGIEVSDTVTAYVQVAQDGDGLVNTNEDTPYIFAVTDFEFTGTLAADLTSITLTSLPTNGTLNVNGAAATIGQEITKTQIDSGLLTFVPDTNENGAGYDVFEFEVNNGRGSVEVLGGESSLYTVGGAAFRNTDRILANPDNFGLSGTYQSGITIVESSNDISSSYLSQGQVLFGGYVNNGSWTPAELANLDSWVQSGGILISTSDSPSYSAVSSHYGLSIGGTGSSTWQITDDSSPIIDGPFGLVGANGGSILASGIIGYFDSASLAVGDQVIAVDSSNGEPTIVLRSVGDGWILFTSDEGIFRTGITGDGTVNTANDRLVANVFAWASSEVDSVQTYTMNVDVVAINDDPTNQGSLPTDALVTEDISSALDLSSISLNDVDSATTDLTVTLTASAGGVLSSSGTGNVDVLGSGTGILQLTGSVSDLNAYLADSSRINFTSALNSNGDDADSVVVTVNDNGNIGLGGGTEIVLGTVNVDITAVNDAPGMSVPGTQSIVEETSTSITGITVSDLDSPSAVLSTTLTVSNGRLNVSVSGLATISAGANDSPNLTIRGTAADINSTLTSLTYTPGIDVTGTAADTLFVSTNDEGNVGLGPDLTASASIQLDVQNVNDEQQLAVNSGLTVDENSSANAITSSMLRTTDVDHTAAQLIYRLTSVPTTGTLKLAGGTLQTGDTFTQADIDAGAMTYDHSGAERFTDEFTFTVDDGQGANTSGTFSITIDPVNDQAPEITSDLAGASASVTVAENTSVATVVTATDADLPAQTLQFSIVGGIDAALFSVHASNGTLQFESLPNYENPLDSNTDNVYQVTVEVSDGQGLTDQQTISVTVSDVNESAVAAITDLDTSPDNVTENASVGATIGIVAFAVDSDGTDSVSYSLDNDAGGLFSIDGLTGEVSVAGMIDRETAADHSIVVRASSTDGSAQTRSFTIMVNDVDEFDVTPVVDLNTTSNVIDENMAVGTDVGIIAFTDDADSTNSTITYTLDDDASGLFAIDEVTGVVSTARLIDYEVNGPSHSVIVRATSDDGSTAVQTFSITVRDINEFGVTVPIDVDATDNRISENVSFGSSVGLTVSSVDGDTTNSQVSYTLDDSAGGLFQIDPNSGNVSVAGAVDFEAVGGLQTITVRATSQDGSSATASFTIAVDDLNDNAPVITPAQRFQVAEHATNGTTVGLVDATDADTVGTLQSWGILSGNDAGIFSIDSSGLISVTDNRLLNYEVNSQYVLQIVVSDGQNPAQVTSVIVDVTDQADAPVFQHIGPFSIAENSGDGTIVGTIAATDEDVGSTRQYVIAGGSTAFSIDALTGQIRVTDSFQLNFEATDSFQLDVEVRDNQGLNDTASVTIQLQDVNEAPYSLWIDQLTVNENTSAGTFVATATASDVDAGDQVTFQLQNAGSIPFEIDSTTGAISVVSGWTLDHESNSTYQVTLVATDRRGLSSSSEFEFQIMDVNERPIIQKDRFQGSVIDPIVFSVQDLMLNDSDPENDQLVFVSISSPNSGTLTLQSDGTYIYQPDTTFSGVETITYVISDGNLISAAGTIELAVEAVAGNQASEDANSESGSGDSGPPISDGLVLVDTFGENGSESQEEENDDELEDDESNEANNEIRSEVGTVTDAESEFADETEVGPEAQNPDAQTAIFFRNPNGSREGMEFDEIRVDAKLGDRVGNGELGSSDSRRSVAYKFRFGSQGSDATPFLEHRSFDVSLTPPAAEETAGLLKVPDFESLVVSSAAVTSVSMTTGYMVWLLRGGTLVTSMLSSLPLWQRFDPIQVINAFEEEEGESLAELVVNSEVEENETSTSAN